MARFTQSLDKENNLNAPSMMACSGFSLLGRMVILILSHIGGLATFAVEAVSHCFRPPYYGRQLGLALVHIGYYSLPVVGLTAIFSGMVLALQSYTGFARFSAEGSVATVVVLSMTRELGPVLAGLMVAGRVGASIAAEIATMKVTEQIDALITLSVNPFKYLVVPRVIAGAITVPLLVVIADIIGVLGGYLVGIYKLDFNSGIYLYRTFQYLETIDVVSGLVKAGVFGFIISLMGCYSGYHASRGAAGVGLATTKSVVSASLLILIANYFLTTLFFGN